MGVSEWDEDRLLVCWKADRQRLSGIVQRHLPGRMPGHSLVTRSQGGKAAD